MISYYQENLRREEKKWAKQEAGQKPVQEVQRKQSDPKETLKKEQAGILANTNRIEEIMESTQRGIKDSTVCSLETLKK